MLEGCCRKSKGWLKMLSVLGFPAFGVECMTSGPSPTTPQDTSITYAIAALSSLVEAGTVNDLRELSKWVHCVHRFLCSRYPLSYLVRDILSRVQGLIQYTNPGQELCQSWGGPISTPHPLPVVSQTEQSSMSDRHVNVVPIWQDLLSEGAVIFAVGVLETMEYAHM